MANKPDINEIAEALKSFISSSIVDHTVDFDTHTVLSTLGIDSFSLIEIVLFIERKYGVVLADESLTPDNLKSINSIAICTYKQLTD
ncbi:MAG TPA: acyl carrier protein [Bacteroidia bacterium]|nr:acyl carrier protein [Bacteroidia bacterium]HRH07816.1 acyl carrier protein [Bacteroidia bacterium]HRH61814.1 acyl carrier protein [Bacteroidia bacterium]